MIFPPKPSFSVRKAPTLATVMCKSNASHCQHPIAPRELINQNREEAEDVNASDLGELIFGQSETHDGNNPTKPKNRRRNVGCENKKQQKKIENTYLYCRHLQKKGPSLQIKEEN